MKTVIVLGAPRSGTSLMAGMLHKAGTCMGHNFVPPQPANPRGFYEDMDFVELDTRLLTWAGGSWAYPPPVERVRQLALRADVQESMRGCLYAKAHEALDEGYTAWGFKDNRACLLLPLYFEYLMRINTVFIVMHRNPMDTAQSCVRVWPEWFDSPVRALRVIYEYGQRIMSFLAAAPWSAVHVGFDGLFDDPEGTARAVTEVIGVPLDLSHLEAGLRHFGNGGIMDVRRNETDDESGAVGPPGL